MAHTRRRQERAYVVMNNSDVSKDIGVTEVNPNAVDVEIWMD